MPDGQIILSNYKETPVVTGFIDGRMEFLSFDRDSQLNNIYVGKVDHIVKNLNAAFIKYDGENIGYLPFNKISGACVLNREIDKDGSLKNGDEVIVQLESEAVKTKKAKLSTAISISGKYSVITLGRNGVGASVKLSDEIRKSFIDRTRPLFEAIKDTYKDNIYGTDIGLIVRTNASDIDPMEYDRIISDDIKDCIQRLSSILSEGRTRTIYTCLHHAEKNAIDKAKTFLKNSGIDESAINIIEDNGIHGIKSKIDELRQNRIWLKSGAFIIIEQVESFNAIDVNTGKAIKGKNNISLDVNMEAAGELMRQIRLRNLTGMILIDFINMKSDEDYEKLIAHMKKLCRQDQVHTNYIDITGLGIMELTRNKNDKSLKEILHEVENTVDNRC
ncbi:ribonuclease E/G [Butyrivibrio sp. VCB2006]|uniref:ribonuclease E/G n=1 Tax=Butyrivibrio sp. VCB2006 TaxID=1280679 RepID=UPI000407F3EF|nr:ribonuclease E/G [Butyrivibrio sp. VCB2006]